MRGRKMHAERRFRRWRRRMYGVSSNSLGIVVAWPAFMSLIVITAKIRGVLTGEWNGSGRKPLQVMYTGLADWFIHRSAFACEVII
jgi:hypothetical protein